MTQQEERQENRQAARGGTPPGASDFVAESRHRLDGLVEAQSQFWDRVQTSNRKWFDRLQDETTMAADFANRLTSAKSLTETASLVQSWTFKHMEMAAEDARHMLSDTQDLLSAGARFWTNVTTSGGDGKSRGH